MRKWKLAPLNASIMDLKPWVPATKWSISFLGPSLEVCMRRWKLGPLNAFTMDLLCLETRFSAGKFSTERKKKLLTNIGKIFSLKTNKHTLYNFDTERKEFLPLTRFIARAVANFHNSYFKLLLTFVLVINYSNYLNLFVPGKDMPLLKVSLNMVEK